MGVSSAAKGAFDRRRQKAEPLRDWRKPSVLLHMLLMVLANAKNWSLCRNLGRRQVRAITARN